MQTFMPFTNFDESAQSLDRQRLGKQRVEVWQILKALSGESAAWRNHPVTKAWEGHIGALVKYGLAICREWIDRGYKDSMTERILAFAQEDDSPPPWLGRERVHAAYRSLLIGKKPEHYRDVLGWDDSPVDGLDYGMFWQK